MTFKDLETQIKGLSRTYKYAQLTESLHYLQVLSRPWIFREKFHNFQGCL